MEGVVLQCSDPTGRVRGHPVQLAGVLVGGQLVLGELQGGALKLHDLVQLLSDLLEGTLQAHAVQLLLAGLSQALHQLVQALNAPVDAAPQQVLDGPGRVDAVQQVISDLGQHLIG